VMLEELGKRMAAGMPPHMPVPFYFMRNGRFQREEL
jgi:hypothetical protein